MESQQIFSNDNFFGKYEMVIRKELGNELDGFKKQISEIQGECSIRMMNIDFSRPNKASPISVDELISCDSEFRCKTLAALFYNDSLWRLEAAHLMMCTGMLNVAYTNLRTVLDALAAAFIVERCGEEALNFLEKEGYEVNLKLAGKFIENIEYQEVLLGMKDAYNSLGVHPCFKSLQLSSMFGVNRFEKLLIERKTKEPRLPKGFVNAARFCIQQGSNVGILFSWLMKIPSETKK